MQERARRRIPGMTQLLSKRPDQFAPGVWPGYFSRAKGAEVWDLDGNRYIDMSLGGIGANVLGYADPDVDAAVKETLEAGTSCTLNGPEEVELAELLCELHPWAEMARFARTGGESMAIAVRIARCHTGRDKIAFCGYHGWHDWYLAANLGTENALGEHLLSGLKPAGVPQGLKGTALPFRYNCPDELNTIMARHKREIAAIVMEPIRNTQPLPGFLEKVRATADEVGAVLIFDEISSGFRLACGGAHLVLGVTPDMAVFSKALGNGYPIGAVIGRAEVMEAAQNTFISSTYWTERIGPTAALAMIRKYRRYRVQEHLAEIGGTVQTGWRTLGERRRLPLQVGGILPMGHLEFQDAKKLALKALFVQRMLERGYLASTAFYSMYAHQAEQVASYLKAADEVFKEMADLLQSDRVEESLKGPPAAAGFQRLT